MRGLNTAQLNHKKAVIIYNPFAGRIARKQHLLQRTIETFAASGVTATLVPTTGPNTAGLLAKQAIAQGAELVVAAGGDGTINEIANGMAHSNVPLAILPGGTANVLAHELKLPSGIIAAAGEIARGIPVRVPLGAIQTKTASRYFLMMAGVGLDARIVYELNLDLKAAIGKLAYYASGFSQVFGILPQFVLEVNGERHRCGFALFSRVRNYGGDLEIATETSLFDDRF